MQVRPRFRDVEAKEMQAGKEKLVITHNSEGSHAQERQAFSTITREGFGP